MTLSCIKFHLFDSNIYFLSIASLHFLFWNKFSAWFLNETGHNTPYNFDLDPQTMREVAEAAETMGGGAERDGGMWGLARMIGNTVKDGKEKGNVLKLEAGEIQSDEDLNLEGTLRRRRRGNSRRIIR